MSINTNSNFLNYILLTYQLLFTLNSFENILVLCPLEINPSSTIIEAIVSIPLQSPKNYKKMQ